MACNLQDLCHCFLISYNWRQI